MTRVTRKQTENRLTWPGAITAHSGDSAGLYLWHCAFARPILGSLAQGANCNSVWPMPRKYNTTPEIAHARARYAAAVQNNNTVEAEKAARDLRNAMFQKRLRDLDESLHTFLAECDGAA